MGSSVLIWDRRRWNPASLSIRAVAEVDVEASILF